MTSGARTQPSDSPVRLAIRPTWRSGAIRTTFQASPTRSIAEIVNPETSISHQRRPWSALRGKARWLWCHDSPSEGIASHVTLVERSVMSNRRLPKKWQKLPAPGAIAVAAAGRPSARGPDVSLEALPASWRLAAAALDLADGDELVVANEHLGELLLIQAAPVVEQIARTRLAAFAGLTPAVSSSRPHSAKVASRT